jgi:hypothetical protein
MREYTPFPPDNPNNAPHASAAAPSGKSALLLAFDGDSPQSMSVCFTAFRMLEIKIGGERTGIFGGKAPCSLCLMSELFQPRCGRSGKIRHLACGSHIVQFLQSTPKVATQ